MKMVKLILLTFGIWMISLHLIAQTDSFQDCGLCPEMIIIPTGSVMIGSSENEIDRKRGERLPVEATIEKSFAIAKTEVTLSQYRRFIEETNYQSVIPKRDGKCITKALC